MNEQKRNASRRLSMHISWELVVFVLLLVTVLGVALRAPLKSFPNMAMSRASVQQLERDPYDLQPERSLNESRVETGL